ncbi:MAG: O-antigen ligase family protein [Candidatus Omnitrophica bacterium]|nr:O-antigen ligase family protein [Candidatus Omnitrophota bacterium]
MISILAIIKYLLELRYFFSIEYIQIKRTSFPLVNPNTLAGFLILCIPFVLDRKNLYPLLFIILITILLTKSFGASISLFFGLVMYLYLKEKKSLREIIKITLMISIIIIYIFYIRQKTYAEMSLFLSFKRRCDYWKQTFNLIKMHPFIGWGLANFKLTSTLYSHNLLLQLLAEVGLLGTISFIWLIILSFKYTFLNIKYSLDKILYLQIFIANTVFLIHNLLDFTFFLPEVSFFWWLFLGMGMYNG